MMWFYKKKGFTLLELMIVVIIVGILASLAIPRFIGARNRAIKAEAYNMLGAIRSSQMRYYLEYDNDYYASGADIAALDIESTTSEYYTYVGADGNPPTTYIGGAESADTSLVPNMGIEVDGTITEGVTVW